MSSNSSAPFGHALVFLAGLALAGCTGTPIPAEKTARREAAELGRRYRPEGRKPPLPALTAESAPADYLKFALLNHPQVEAAFYDWNAAVEAITPARSLPDPQFTLQADFVRSLTSLMPGVAFGGMTPRKLAALGREAAATSDVSYRAFIAAMAGAALELRQSWIDCAYLDATAALLAQKSAAVAQALALTQVEYTTGRGTGTLEAQIHWVDEGAKLTAQGASLEDQRASARARFKAALGLRREEADPPWPAHPLPAAPLPDGEALWREVFGSNPDLASLRSVVEMTVASAEVARRTGSPDFTVGLMSDLRADPLLFRTWDTMTLPLWRDKVAAVAASAEDRRRAAQARLDAGQVTLAAEVAQMLFVAREADRQADYLENTALPNTDRTLAAAEAGYQSGSGGFASLLEPRLLRIDAQLDLAAARRDRERALADLSRLAAGDAAAGDVAKKDFSP